MSSSRPLSLATRSLLATITALVAFLGLTGLVLQHACYNSALSILEDNLRGYVYAYLAVTDVGRDGRLLPPDLMPYPEFGLPASGLYAIIESDEHGRWESPSAVGRELPFHHRLAPGQSSFTGPIDTSVGAVYVFSLGVTYDTPRGKPVNLTIYIAQNQEQFAHRLWVYRRTLFAWLLALGVALVLLQLLLLRWSLSPLRRVASDMRQIRNGQHQRLAGDYPSELSGLTRSLNAFIESERERMARYRHTLENLAHSLKTPVTVARSRLETIDADPKLRRDLGEQIQRMNDIVAYQLSRSATSGSPTFATPVPINGHAEDLVRSLEKAHAPKGVLCEFDIDATASFYGAQGDLLELLGNLLENAFKWCGHRVILRAHALDNPYGQRSGLNICVEDDGPGIPSEEVALVTERGVRGDERVQGHGIGLAIVQDIVRAYRGQMQVCCSRELGGACFCIRFKPA